MGTRLRRFLIGLFALAAIATAPVGAQPSDGPGYSQDELDQLLAPVALYPDELLMQVLIASTYPLEVVEAARFVQQNPDLRGDALDEALAARNWDPSVQSLAAFPQVLAMMNEALDWMQRLGDAFLVDQQRVMDTVQSLRGKAQALGNLQSTPQQSVSTQGSVIIIEPAQPDVVYVPAYNPIYVYGPWWAPDYPPWWWYPPAVYGYPVWGGITAGIYFGTAWPISHHHWGWVRTDWHRHHVNIHTHTSRFWNRPGRPPPPSGGDWRHEPRHRRGVAYPDLATHDRFRRVNPDAVRSRQEFRGRERVQPSPNVMRPSPGAPRPGSTVTAPTYNLQRPTPNAAPAPQGSRPAPGARVSTPQSVQPLPRQIAPAPALDPRISRQQAETNALRGQQSRQFSRPPAAPSAHAPAAPSARPPSAPSAQPPSSAPAAPSSRPPSASPAPRGGVQKH